MIQLESLTKLQENSDEFSKKNSFGSISTTCKTLLERGNQKEELLNNANSAYPIIHHKVLKLMTNFLQMKQNHGSLIEKEVYKDITIPQFVDRLMLKRPLMFVGQRDHYILRDHAKQGQAGDDWHKIGTQEEVEPFLMKEYITYDEGKIAALIGTGSWTDIINKGGRQNMGEFDSGDGYEKRGVIVGLAGPRMNKTNALESQELRVTEEQNDPEFGYGKKNQRKTFQLFANFYGMEYIPTFSEVDKSYTKEQNKDTFLGKIKNTISKSTNSISAGYQEFLHLKNTRQYLHIDAFTQRMKLSAEILLAEAGHRAKLAKKKAYVHVVGLGLGVWKICQNQPQMFADIYATTAANMNLPSVSDIDLSWINVDFCTVAGHQVKSGDTIPGTSTTLHISKREPWDLLDDKEKIVVASWAWDGMSFVGNEYWAGSLHTSSDPAAACCTQIPELHNPWVNPVMCGANARVVTQEGQLQDLVQFVANHGK